MDDAANRLGDPQQSKETIGRLHALDCALRNADRAFRLPLATQPIESTLKQYVKRGRSQPNLGRLIVGPEYVNAATELVKSIGITAERIATRLGQRWRESQIEGVRNRRNHADGSTWTLGTVDLELEARPILRGEVELLRAVPIAPDLPDAVVEYLVTVPGTRDQLARERHGHWGYHYHYLDSKSRRSDTLLTFGRNAALGSLPTLCWERHAERQKFKARAFAWGADKRESIYSICHPDTLRFLLTDFKYPASTAEAVWPLT